MIALYVAAAVAANLVIAWLGPTWTIPVAFVMIGCTLTVRDRLHDRWQGSELALRMLFLITGAGVLSYIAHPDAGRIGVASMIAFIVSEIFDASVYGAAKTYTTRQRAALYSNAVGALFDTTIFLWLAFGAFTPKLFLFMWGAKVIGGQFWVRLLYRGNLYTRLGYRCHLCVNDRFPCVECAIGKPVPHGR